MSDEIRVLSDAVANQIAAGEVVQRPASVVKELVENAVDAGATSVAVVVKDGGRQLVQVIDNGKGMSPTDALRSFERHATSKIRSAGDLFALHTFGFRGEALASIASVAEVSLRSRRPGDEVGTEVNINGSVFGGQNPVSCPVGSQFTVRNLFYNTPARRKFMKSNQTENTKIISEFQQIVLCNPEVEFSLHFGDKLFLSLPPSNLRQRVTAVMGRTTGKSLIDIAVDTSIVSISGFIGTPDCAKKKKGEQYFFVNGRYFHSAYLQKAVLSAYDKILQADYIPSFFIYLNVDPSQIDVNVHPTKTEVKFEDEQSVWKVIFASVRESLGKHGIVPSLDFDVENQFDIPVYNKSASSSAGQVFRMPTIDVNPNYNPFKVESAEGWEQLYDGFERNFDSAVSSEDSGAEEFSPFEDIRVEQSATLPTQGEIEIESRMSDVGFFQTGRYIVLKAADGVTLIDWQQANYRILYESFVDKMSNDFSVNQQELFPETLELSAADHFTLSENMDTLAGMGFDIREMGGTSMVVYGIPVELENMSPKVVIESIIHDINEKGADLKDNKIDKLAAIVARNSCRTSNRKLSDTEIAYLVDKLYLCREPNYTPDGKTIIVQMPINEIDKKFKR